MWEQRREPSTVGIPRRGPGNDSQTDVSHMLLEVLEELGLVKTADTQYAFLCI